MTAVRPSIEPAVAATIVAAAPARLIKRLDAAPALAEAWTWSMEGATCRVTTDTGETVSLRADGGTVTRVEDVTCTCLLSPRCLHVLAAATRLPLGDPSAQLAGPDPATPFFATPAPTTAIAASDRGDDARTRAAAHAFDAGAAILAAGADASGAVAVAELLRAVHACRAHGAHRVAAAGTRVARWIHELHADGPEFALGDYAADLAELLAAAHIVATARPPDPAWLGSARREYLPAGHLHLQGVFSEAIVARSGHAGVVTYLTDGNGRLFTRADVAPGGAERAAGSYDSPAAIGDAVLSHRELGRTGLFVAEATVSRDGRLGAGASVKAVRARAPATWTDEPVARLWRDSLPAQIDRIAAADELPADERAAGWDLAFVEGTVRGARGDVVLLEVPTAEAPTTLRLTASAHPALRHRDNLIALGRAAGAVVRVIGRVRLAVPQTLDLLAVGPVGAAAFELPAAWHGRANLAWDPIPALASTALTTTTQPPTRIDPLAAMRRRIERAALGGLASLPPEARPALEREAALLERRLLGGAAVLLRDLASAACPPHRTFTGERRVVDRAPFARNWTRAARYAEAARRAIAQRLWL